MRPLWKQSPRPLIDSTTTALFFIRSGVREDFNLPRQHFYAPLLPAFIEFGAPKWSVALQSQKVDTLPLWKKPWRRSNRYKALSQMLLTNQRLDKLNAFSADLVHRGMIPCTHTPPPEPFDTGDEDSGPIDNEKCHGTRLPSANTRYDNLASIGTHLTLSPLERGYPRDLYRLAHYIHQPSLPDLARRFLL